MNSNAAFVTNTTGPTADKKPFCVATMSEPKTTIWMSDVNSTIDEGGNLWYDDPLLGARNCIPFHNIAQIQFR